MRVRGGGGGNLEGVGSWGAGNDFNALRQCRDNKDGDGLRRPRRAREREL